MLSVPLLFKSAFRIAFEETDLIVERRIRS